VRETDFVRTVYPIGQEAVSNWALQFTDRDRFVEAMVANLPDRLSYFNRSVTINLRGAPFVADRAALAHLGPAEFNADTAVQSQRAFWNWKASINCLM
jgi:hypothetical protein